MYRFTNKTKGILCIITAALCFSLMSFFVRLSGDLPSMQKALFRNMVALMVVVIPMKVKGEKIAIKKEDIKDLLGRASFGTIGLLGNF